MLRFSHISSFDMTRGWFCCKGLKKAYYLQENIRPRKNYKLNVYSITSFQIRLIQLEKTFRMQIHQRSIVSDVDNIRLFFGHHSKWCIVVWVPLRKLVIINLKGCNSYLTNPFAPFAIESMVLPSMRIYAKEPSNPAPKLKKGRKTLNFSDMTGNIFLEKWN